MYTNFSVRDGKVYYNKEKGKRVIPTYIGNDFNIVGYRYNVDTEQCFVRIQGFSVMRGKFVEFELDKETMNSKQLTRSLNKILSPVLDENRMYDFFKEKEACLLESQELLRRKNSYLKIDDVFKHLFRKNNDEYNITASSTEEKFVHTYLGWKNIDGKLVFQGAESYGGDNSSTYIGTENIQPMGTFKNVEKLYADVVENNSYLQLVSAMGVSATVLGFVNARWGLALPNPIYSLAGTTTEGKSTAIELAVSMGGRLKR